MFSKERVQTFVQGKVKELWLIQSFAGALKKTKTMHILFFLKKPPETIYHCTGFFSTDCKVIGGQDFSYL